MEGVLPSCCFALETLEDPRLVVSSLPSLQILLYPQLAPLQSWVHPPSWDRLGQPEGKFKPCICLAPSSPNQIGILKTRSLYLFLKKYTLFSGSRYAIWIPRPPRLCTWDSAHGLSVHSLTAFYKSFPRKSEASLRFTGGCSSVPPPNLWSTVRVENRNCHPARPRPLLWMSSGLPFFDTRFQK